MTASASAVSQIVTFRLGDDLFAQEFEVGVAADTNVLVTAVLSLAPAA